MIKPIITDQFILSQKSTLATQEDLPIVQDLLDTIKAHETHCVGMAANMIGINKRIIVINDDGIYLVMINPEIIKEMGQLYEIEEGCLSHLGAKKTKRYEKIKVAFYDKDFKKKIKTFNNYSAQIIQHEIDHCNGVLI
ncbi:MAG: peptide deformylase [Thomasclavelia sp.]|uniref:peptide deformylase n=1 Tax=Thomasclavelia sp. TaxID=3025757 RepID=UPI00399FA302